MIQTRERGLRGAAGRTAIAAFSVLGALVLAPSLLFADASGHYTLSGDRVAVYNLVGTMKVVSGSGPEVIVDVRILGEDAAKLTVETGRIDGRQTLRVIYPDDRIHVDGRDRWSRTEFDVRDDGTFGDNGQGHRVVLSGGSGLRARAEVTVSVPSGRTCAVYLGAGEATADGIDGHLRMVTLSAPVTTSGTSGSLAIKVGSGDVEVSGASGKVDVGTGSGNVTCRNIKADDFALGTGSGDVEARSLEAVSMSVKTGSGDIELSQVKSGDVTLGTGSGDVHVDLQSDIDALTVRTGSGGVTVRVPDNLGAEVRVSTGSGGIRIGVPHEEYTHKHSFFSGRIGDGHGEVRISTGSGDVRILEI